MTTAQIADAALLTVFLVAAAAALARRGARPTGMLVAIVALTWVVGSWMPPLLWAHRAALVYLVFAFPALVPRPRGFIAVASILAAASALPLLALDERATAGIGAAVVLGALLRFAVTPRLQRRPLGAAMGAAGLLAAALVAPIALRSLGAPAALPLAAYCTCLALVVILLVVHAMVANPHTSTVTSLIGDLSDVVDTGTLRVRLARALGDPSLRIGYLGGSGELVDDDGRPITEAGGSERTPVMVGGRPVAVLLHDPALRIDLSLAEPIGAVIDLALRNVRLNDDVRARATAIQDSRARLLDAEEAARRDVERALRDGPMRRLQRAAELIRQRDDAGPLLEAVGRASADVRRFGRGLLPAAALEPDLARTLTDMAHGFPFPIDLDLDGLLVPLSDDLRPTIWFTCAEAITNAAKYADPQHVHVAVRSIEDSGVIITVTDDGRGGASMGPGLRGIADRVQSMGGSLELASPVGAGTTVRVRLPLRPILESV